MANLVRTRERRETMAARVRVVSALIGLGLALVAGAYWVAQGIHGPEYREEADNNRLRRLPISAPRGVVYDREGRPLAENVPSYNLLLEPQAAPSIAKSLAFAAAVLDTDTGELKQLPAEINAQGTPVEVGVATEKRLHAALVAQVQQRRTIEIQCRHEIGSAAFEHERPQHCRSAG